MMHYRNGREAKNGDTVVQLNMGDGGFAMALGVIYNAKPGNDYCNGSIAPVQQGVTGACMCDCLHVDDLAAILKEKGLDKRPPASDRMARLCLLWCVALLAALMLRAGDGPDPEDVELADFAPTRDYIELDPHVIVGRPDFTGTAPWMLEEVTRRNLDGPGDRNKSTWHQDPSTLPERPIGDADYLHSERSRGHGAAAANHSESQKATDSTHNYFNCYPQDQPMNAQIWERTEERERELAASGAKVRSVCLRIFELKSAGQTEGGCPLWSLRVTAQGPNQVWRPTHLAKSIRVELHGRIWLENYLVENSPAFAGDDIDQHRVACDVIEEKANLDLWPAPPRLKGKARERWLAQQEELESRIVWAPS